MVWDAIKPMRMLVCSERFGTYMVDTLPPAPAMTNPRLISFVAVFIGLFVSQVISDRARRLPPNRVDRIVQFCQRLTAYRFLAALTILVLPHYPGVWVLLILALLTLIDSGMLGVYFFQNPQQRAYRKPHYVSAALLFAALITATLRHTTERL